MQIDILFVPDCPHVARARLHLQRALEVTAVEASVHETEVATPEAAARLGMRGSPTLLIDGLDPFPSNVVGGSLACRLYKTGHRVDGAPTVTQLVGILVSAADGSRSKEDQAMGPAHGFGELLGSGLDEVENALATAGFLALWAGRAERPEQLLRQSPDARTAAAALARRGRAELDEEGRLVGVHGLTLRPTRHRFVHNGRVHQTWCAFDSIGIPAALELDAEARTDCPACGRRVTVRLRGGVPQVDGAPMLWLPHPPEGNLLAEFCSCADLYCSLEHLRLQVHRAKAGGTPTDLAAVAQLGRETWDDLRRLASGRNPMMPRSERCSAGRSGTGSSTASR